MNLATLELDQRDISNLKRVYKHAKGKQAAAVRTTLDALKAGEMVINLARVIDQSYDRPETSYRSEGRTRFPRMAVAPVTAQGEELMCRVRMNTTQFTLSKDEFLGRGKSRKSKWSLELPISNNIIRGEDRGTAMVPVIPDYIHYTKGDLVLFEVDNWNVKEQPIDPAIIECIAGTVYRVKAIWDLTPLEQALLTS